MEFTLLCFIIIILLFLDDCLHRTKFIYFYNPLPYTERTYTSNSFLTHTRDFFTKNILLICQKFFDIPLHEKTWKKVCEKWQCCIFKDL